MFPLGLSAGMSTADAAIQKNIYGSGTTALLISNEEMEYIIKTVKSLESELLLRGTMKQLKIKQKQQKVGFLPMLLGTLAASILGSVLAWRRVIRAGEGTIRTGKNF